MAERSGSTSDGKALWLCRCDCGSTAKVEGKRLRSGETQSCGCLRGDVSREKATKHGYYGTSTYTIWFGMLERCRNPKNKSFCRYGGRGIRVCERWHSFENFLADMGERPPGLTIERSNNEGNYEPGNCRWATYKEQANNRRRNGRIPALIACGDLSLSINQWAERLGVKPETIRSRLKKGWTEERAVTEPLHKHLTNKGRFNQ